MKGPKIKENRKSKDPEKSKGSNKINYKSKGKKRALALRCHSDAP